MSHFSESPPWYRLGVIDFLYSATKPVFFRLDPERVHDRVISVLGRISQTPFALNQLQRAAASPDPRLSISIGTLNLAGPVGIAAGLDKNAVAYPALGALGWDYVEVGTITVEAQDGNPKPRMFRLPEDHALDQPNGFPGARRRRNCHEHRAATEMRRADRLQRRAKQGERRSRT